MEMSQAEGFFKFFYYRFIILLQYFATTPKQNIKAIKFLLGN